MKTNFNFNGKNITLDLIVKGHSKKRECERREQCDFALIGQTMKVGLPYIVKEADDNKARKVAFDLMLVDEWNKRSVCLNCVWKGTVLQVIVITVINQGRNIFITKPETTTVVKV